MNAAQLASFERDGFLVLPDFLSGADCDTLQARAAELVLGFDPGARRTIFSTRDQGHARDRYFLESGGDIRFFFEEEVPAELNKIGARCTISTRCSIASHASPSSRRSPTRSAWPSLCCCNRCTSSSSPESGAKWLASGRDLPAYDARQRGGFWIALDDADRENGCLFALPGAHRGSLRNASAGRAMRWSPTSSMRRHGRPSSRYPSRSGAARSWCCTACCRTAAAPIARLGRVMPIRCI